jgi:hypothetical protein
MRNILLLLIAGSASLTDAKTDVSFGSIVEDADKERELIQSATKKFRAIAARMPSVFRQ